MKIACHHDCRSVINSKHDTRNQFTLQITQSTRRELMKPPLCLVVRVTFAMFMVWIFSIYGSA